MTSATEVERLTYLVFIDIKDFTKIAFHDVASKLITIFISDYYALNMP